MSIEKIYPFDDPINYTFGNNVKVSSGNTSLSLVDYPSQNYLQEFTNDTGFTYDNTKAEFVGGVLRQKDQRPSDATFAATYSSTIDGTWGDGVLTGTATGGASIVGNELDLTGGGKYVTYSGTDNALLQQTGCIRFEYTPNHSGSPASPEVLFSIGESTLSNNNEIQIINLSITTNQVRIRDNAGNIIMNTIFAFNPTAGTTYEFELNFDVTAGLTELYVDKTRILQDTSTGTRSTNIGYLRVGADRLFVYPTDCKMSDFILYDTVQHTGASYTGDYVIPENIYVDNKVELPIYIVPGPGEIQSIDVYTVTDTGSTQYTLGESSEVQFYWDGAAWAVSDQTYAQSNDAATIEANLLSLVATLSTVVVDVYFTDTMIQSNVDEIDVEFTSQIYSTTNPIIEPNDSFILEGLEFFEETATKAGSDEVKYILKKGTSWYYWDSAAWVVSDETYAQSNTAAEIETNKSSFTTSRETTKVRVFLHSTDGSTTPLLDQLKILYNFAGDTPDSINKCIVYGYIYDESGAAISGCSVSASLNKTVAKYKTNTILKRQTQTDTTDANGYWEIELVETENAEVGTQYKFVINGYEKTLSVPNEETKSFWDLT